MGRFINELENRSNKFQFYQNKYILFIADSFVFHLRGRIWFNSLPFKIHKSEKSGPRLLLIPKMLAFNYVKMADIQFRICRNFNRLHRM